MYRRRGNSNLLQSPWVGAVIAHKEIARDADILQSSLFTFSFTLQVNKRFNKSWQFSHPQPLSSSLFWMMSSNSNVSPQKKPLCAHKPSQPSTLYIFLMERVYFSKKLPFIYGKITFDYIKKNISPLRG